MKKGKIIYVFSLICAIFGTVILICSKMYLYAIFLALTIPVLIKKIKEEYKGG
jgi:hypothetical protein